MSGFSWSGAHRVVIPAHSGAQDPEHIWPSWGEFDIIEGVHRANRTMTTLHTTPGCSQSDVRAGLALGGAGRETAGRPSRMPSRIVQRGPVRLWGTPRLVSPLDDFFSRECARRVVAAITVEGGTDAMRTSGPPMLQACDSPISVSRIAARHFALAFQANTSRASG